MNDATARRHDVLRAAMTLDDQLDDIKRAQIWSHLEPQLPAPAPTRRRWPIALAAAAVAAALVALWLRPTHPAARTLSAPAETTLATTLGPHARAELVGPASLDVLGAAGDATSVRLHTGTLVAEFTGGPGRSLRIETRDAVVEIVGTLFSVEAREGATCVSVAHGKVRVTTHAGVVAVAGGESWCSTRPDVMPLEPAADDRLARFAAVITARADAPRASLAGPAPVPAAVTAAAPASHAVAAPQSVPAAAPASASAAVTAPVSAAAPARSEPPPSAPPPASIPAAAPPSTTAATPASADTTAAASTATAPASTAAAPASTAAIMPGPSEPSTTAPAPAPAAAPMPVPAAAPASPESLYEAAEAALARRDAAGADRILARLLTDFPHASLVDQALFERARIAYGRHAWRDAQQDLDQLAAVASTPLAEPGAYLACRIALEAHDGAAEHCLIEYRKAYPRSPHDLDVLGVLTDLAYRDGGCARARPRIDELVRAYQRTTLAGAWLDRCPEGR